MIIDGKRLSEDERLKFLADLEHTGEFCELVPLGSIPLVQTQVVSQESKGLPEAPSKVDPHHQPTQTTKLDDFGLYAVVEAGEMK